MAGERILILEDDRLLVTVLTARFEQEGWETTAAGSLAAARAAVASQEFDVTLSDLRLPDGESLTLLEDGIPPAAGVFLLMTAHATVGSAVKALKLGAKDYLEKPFSLDRAVATVRDALEMTALRRELVSLRERTSLAGTNVIGESAVMQNVFGLIRRLAAAEASTVLIEGESGTGKGAIAQALHRLSRRGKGPFVNVTCAGIPDTLMESELFGHERGAFTDAHTAKRGLVEMATGGTIFMDEIGEVSPGVQAKLLRFIEEKTYRRLGGTKDLSVDARIVAATNRDLATEVDAGRFRADLYYRLRVVPIVLPPLRERGEDIERLARHFAAHFAGEFAKRIAGITPEAVALLAGYRWPGNVRELRNVMERAVLLADGETIGAKELPPEIARPRASATTAAPAAVAPATGATLDEIERSLVEDAMHRAHGNQSLAAKLLGVTRHRLRTLCRRYGVTAALLLALLPAALAAQAPSRSACNTCHADRELLARRAPAGHLVDSLVVDAAVLAGSAHASLTCARCHPNHDQWPHPQHVRTAIPCGNCHAQADSAWTAGVHAQHADSGAACVDCHGDHEVRTLEQLRTKDGKALVDSSCVSCHPARTLRPGDAHATEAGCADCHGPHRVRAARDTVGIAAGCAGCHEEVARDAATDVHGEAVHRHAPGQAHAGEGPMPTCVACHGGHGIPAKTALERDSTIAARCGTCHTNAARSYGDSYHGNAARVGSPTAARCASCHGSHRVFARDDPRSMVSEGRLAETCGQCHEPAKNAGLTSYRVHVEKADRHESFIIWASYMFMLALLYGTIGVFGLHTALWLTRTLVERMHQKRWRRQQGLPEPPKRRLALDSADRGKGPYVWRFTLMQRLAHAFTVIAFFALTITGLPLRFSCAVWAPALMSVIGGVTWAGLVHRVAGVILVTNLLVHVGQTTLKVLRSPDWKSNFWGHDSLIPQPRDAVQMLQMFKWFLGLGPRPVFGRWSYMEKFDYFGSFWGVGLLGVTGFIRWFPGLFASFLPGWAYNVAAILHAEEALLAASFLFLVHFFNVHLRPDVFPLSGVMWTGRQRLEAYEEDHPALAAQWTDLASQPVSATPRVDAVAPPPPIWLTVTGAVFGIFAAAVGLAILGLILWVQLC